MTDQIVTAFAPATVSNVACSVDGAGSCGTRTVLSQVRQSVDLEPGDIATVQGTLSVRRLDADRQLRAAVELPFRLAQTLPQAARAEITVPRPLLVDSFE